MRKIQCLPYKMKQLGIALALVFFACWFGQGSAQCMCNDTACINTQMTNSPNTQQCCQWIPQFNDMNPNSLNDPNGTPLGFVLREYRGTDNDNLPDTCVNVNFDSQGSIRYVVVSVQSQTQICINRRNAGNDEEATCGSGGVFFCRSFTSGNSIDIEFFCTGGSCPVNDEVFYLRPNVTSLDTDDEFFCDNINRTLPSALVQDTNQPDVSVNPSQQSTAGATPIVAHLMPALLIVMMLATVLVFH